MSGGSSRFEQVQQLVEKGMSQREIARRMGHSRNTISKLVGLPALHGRKLITARRSSSVDPVRSVPQSLGGRRAAAMRHGCTSRSFRRVLLAASTSCSDWFNRGGKKALVGRGRLRFSPHRRAVCAGFCVGIANRQINRTTKKEQSFVGRLLEACPAVAVAQDLAQRFCRMVRERDAASFPSWLEAAAGCGVPELSGFARGLRQDLAAIQAALSIEWSNGQVEGQVNRLKFIKRSMYGRGGFDLLRSRVLHRAVA